MEIKGRLCKQGKTILDVDLTLPISENICGVYGASGAGKTTLLRCLAGVEADFEGHISVKPETRIALVFQDSALFPHLTVQQNLQLARRFAAPRQGALSIYELATLFECEHLFSQHISSLSGGEQQRVALARALANNPDVLLLDEPVSALDENRRYRLLQHVLDLHTRDGFSVLMVSHSLRELAFVSDYIVQLNAGKIEAEGPLSSMINRLQQHEDVRQYRSLFSVLMGKVIQHHEHYGLTELHCDGQRLFVPRDSVKGESVKVRVEANQVSLDLNERSQSSIINCLLARVVDIEAVTPTRQLVTLSLGTHTLFAEISAWSADKLGIHTGQNLYARFKLP
ncbi:molybdenum ABC transporter ATP-binding protein [Aestuariibacter salexigens]|uniref:molybdenum ABC transporter ATP-binding protein n=1 Tax=Aestuariibacter salexigens TaxID=226010 RepID=UPI0003F92099|nr:ATP-binding cassette domain-containing protein [Aestuariibacter salexigens]